MAVKLKSDAHPSGYMIVNDDDPRAKGKTAETDRKPPTKKAATKKADE